MSTVEAERAISRTNSEWIERLKPGQTFESWDELKEFIVDHGVQTERIIRTYRRDPKRWLAVCKMNWNTVPDDKRCPVRIRAIERKTTQAITIQISILEHTCEASGHWKRRMHTNSDRLALKIIDIVMRNRETRACFLRDTCQSLFHPDISYHTVFQAKRRALEKLFGRECDTFFLIPAHCKHILHRDPGAVAKYAAPDNRFQSLFVVTSAARAALKHCRPLVAFDGTHTRSAFPQILLIATALDANNTVVMLAYCMVPTENPTEWRRFLRLIRDAIPDLSKPGMVFISDREKGLLDGVEEYFPRGFHAFCSWHLGDNCRTKFNKKAQKAFEPLVYATTPDQYKRRLQRIKDVNKKWAEYIEKTAHPKHYSRAYCPVRRWGHETSQQAESLNRALKPQRQEAAFKQSNLLWDYGMTKFFEKKMLANSVTTPFPPNIMTILRHTEEKAMQLIADPSSDIECRVTDHLGRQFLVEFQPEWKCSCGDFQDKLYPCIHAWRACSKLQKRHFDYVSPFYSTEIFKKTYEFSVPAIMHDNLVPDLRCGLPLKKRRRGRPSEKLRMRFSEEDPVRGPRKCVECKEVGHDRRTCPVLDTMKGQSKGRGPTVDSDVEGSDHEHTISAVTKHNQSAPPSDQFSDDGDSGDSIDASTSEISESEEEPEEEFTLDAIAARKQTYCSHDELSDDEQSDDEHSPAEQMDKDEGMMDLSEVLDVSASQSVQELFASQPCTQATTSSKADSRPFLCLTQPSLSCTDLLASVLRGKTN